MGGGHRYRAVLCGAAVALLAAAAPAMPRMLVAAAPFPQFDIAASCRDDPDPGRCAGIESAQRDSLAARWPSLPPGLQRECVTAGLRQRGSYNAALGCAERGRALPPMELR